MPAGITFNNQIWKYFYNGQPYDTLEQAQAAQSGAGGPVPGSLASLQAAAGPVAAYTATAGAAKTAQDQQNLEQSNAAALARQNADRAFQTTESATATQAGKDAAAAAAKTAADAQMRDEAFQTSTTAAANANAQAAQARMLALISPMLSGTAGGTAGTAGGTSTPDPAIAQAAQKAAFGQAKDQTADLARSSLMTLRAAAAERGVNVAGGNNPALLASEGKVISEANKPLADLTRTQAIDTANRATAVDDRDYAGNIALSGQKAQLAPSLLSLLKVGGLY
jgi:hypothetical protein